MHATAGFFGHWAIISSLLRSDKHLDYAWSRGDFSMRGSVGFGLWGLWWEQGVRPWSPGDCIEQG